LAILTSIEKYEEHSSEAERTAGTPYEKKDRPEDIEVEDKFGPLWIRSPEDVEPGTWQKRIMWETRSDGKQTNMT
jgi:hypothetical protein